MKNREVIEFEFIIQAGEQKTVGLEVERPFMLRMFQIDREQSFVTAMSFDSEEMELNGQMNLHMGKHFRLKKGVTLVCSNVKSALPEKVTIRLLGHYEE